MKVPLGAAQGLSFLHEEAERPVIYRDSETSNILLDVVSIESMNWILHCGPCDSCSCICYFICVHVLLQEYNAKLSDFGLAKDGPVGDKTHFYSSNGNLWVCSSRVCHDR